MCCRCLPIFHTHGLFCRFECHLPSRLFDDLHAELQGAAGHRSPSRGHHDDGGPDVLHALAEDPRFYNRDLRNTCVFHFGKRTSVSGNARGNLRNERDTEFLERYGMTETNMIRLILTRANVALARLDIPFRDGSSKSPIRKTAATLSLVKSA